MKYFVDHDEVSKDEFIENISSAIEHILKNGAFNDLLNDSYKEVKMGSLTFKPSQILFNCDPIAYDEWFNEEIYSMVEDYMYEFSREHKDIINDIDFETREE